MAESKDQDVSCPRCSRQQVHFDCEIGFYCTGCGREFSSEEAKVLVEREIFKAGSDD
jgi:DNA-directed RNA polymerase subunit RPC12/RpoP